jgi:putative flippase GtrA
MIARLKARFPRAAALVEPHFGFLRKAVSFALIGVINVGVDSSVFFLAYAYLTSSEAALHPLSMLSSWLSNSFPWTSLDGVVLAVANVISWAVAVTGSYLMNSFFTFAAESGRQFRWRDYRKFAASGILGVIASTAALLAANQVMPVLPAKGCAILTAFAVNFSLSHFVVFRAQRAAPASAPEAVATD